MSFIGSNPKVKTQQYIAQSADPTSPRTGDVFNSDGTVREAGLWQYINSTWVKVGSSGAGGINYITNGDASSGTTGWATYKDAAGPRPVDGTGGTAAITFATNSSTPLRGALDFILSKGAVDAQGEGASYAFTIANADIHTPCQVKIDYKASNNFSFANRDVQVFVYDVTNAQVIDVIPQTLDGSGHFKGEFQSTTSLSYRLILHVATTNANVYTLQVDDVQVGPSSLAYGFLPDKEYNLTVTCANWTTERAVGIPYKTRNGAWRLRFNITGVVSPAAASNALVVSGVTFKSGSNNYQPVALMWSQTAGQAARAYCNPGSSTIMVESSNNNGYPNVSGDVELDSMPTWAVDSSPVQIGDGAETRIVALNAIHATGTIGGGYTVAKFDTVNNDTHGAYSVSTGLYTVPVAGWYNVSSMINIYTTASVSANQVVVGDLYKNGASVITDYQVFETAIGASYNQKIIKINKTLLCAVGDTLGIYTRSSITSPLYNSSSYSDLSINRVSGPASIAAAEIVACRYRSSSGQAISTTLKFESKDYDTHNAYNTTTGLFTAPSSGYYDVYCVYRLSAASAQEVIIYVNGATVHYEKNPSTGDNPCHRVMDKVKLSAGDTIRVGSGNPGTMSSDANENIFIVSKV